MPEQGMPVPADKTAGTGVESKRPEPRTRCRLGVVMGTGPQSRRAERCLRSGAALSEVCRVVPDAVGPPRAVRRPDGELRARAVPAVRQPTASGAHEKYSLCERSEPADADRTDRRLHRPPCLLPGHRHPRRPRRRVRTNTGRAPPDSRDRSAPRRTHRASGGDPSETRSSKPPAVTPTATGRRTNSQQPTVRSLPHDRPMAQHLGRTGFRTWNATRSSWTCSPTPAPPIVPPVGQFPLRAVS